MESRARLLGHPVHQMLIPLPVGLFVVAIVLDIVDMIVRTSWIATVTYWNLIIGLGTGLLAALFGLVDYTKIPAETRAKRVGAVHGIGNLIAWTLLLVAVVWRSRGDRRIDGLSMAFEAVALCLLGVTAWLGGELVDRLGIGVDPGANPNAPSSLRGSMIPRSELADERR